MVTGMGKFRTINLSFMARAGCVRERQPPVMIPSERELAVCKEIEAFVFAWVGSDA